MGLRPIISLEAHHAETSDGVCINTSVLSGSFGNRQGAFEHPFGLICLPLDEEKCTKRVQGVAELAVVSTQHAFAHGQRAIEERSGFSIVALSDVNNREVPQNSSEVNADNEWFPVRLLQACKSSHQERFGVAEAPLTEITGTDIPIELIQVRTVWPNSLLGNLQCSLGEGQRLLNPTLRSVNTAELSQRPGEIDAVPPVGALVNGERPLTQSVAVVIAAAALIPGRHNPELVRDLWVVRPEFLLN